MRSATPGSGSSSATAGAEVARSDPWSQVAMFVIWEKGRGEEGRILADLDRRFEVHRVVDVRWSPRRARRNFERFYCDLDVRGVYHAHNKGTGRLLTVVVCDPDPRIELRATSRGRRFVNGRFLDAKTLYRQWTDEFAVHCSETARETRRDMLMLLGAQSSADPLAGSQPWTGRREVLARDVSGAGGWASASQLFGALDAAVTYVLLGDAPLDRLWDSAGYPQLLTDDYRTTRRVLGARPIGGARLPHGGVVQVRVAGRSARLGIRTPKDGYLDPEWARACLDGRVFDREQGVHRLPPSDALATYAYMSLVHHPEVPAEFSTRLRALAARQRTGEWSRCDPDDLADVKRRLDRYVDERGYRYTRPLDPGVRPNPAFAGTDGGSPISAIEPAGRRFRRFVLSATGIMKRSYLGMRDSIVMRAPWLRRAKAAAGVRVHALRHAVAGLRPSFRVEALKNAILLVRGALFLGRRYRCPCCGWRLRGFVGRWGFVRSNPDGYCPRCNAKARHRRAWLHLVAATRGSERPLRLLEVAPWWSFARAARTAGFLDYVGLDIRRSGRHVDVVGDVTAIPSRDSAYDVVVCVHVLEHVEDDRAAIAEIFRVLRPGGFALISVPLRLDGATREDPSITDPDERLRLFGERSHVRLYGMDLGDRLREAGFDVRVELASALPQTDLRRFGLREDDHIFHGSKEVRPSMPSSA